MEEVLLELLKFSKAILDLGEPIKDDRIEKFEAKYDLKLPDDFRSIISQYNGINLMGTEVYGFHPDKPNSIEDSYDFEHFKTAVPQWKHLVPFSPDGGGNFYCLDLSNSDGQNCPVVFWVSNYRYSDDDTPEIVYGGFVDWIREVMIGWTLEDYDYEGNPKS